VNGPPIAAVFDADFQIVHRGRAYWMSPVPPLSVPPDGRG
jgi:hypothetical protein